MLSISLILHDVRFSCYFVYYYYFIFQEFEIIAQIKLLQEAAKNYDILPDEAFRLWFDNIKTFSESER